MAEKTIFIVDSEPTYSEFFFNHFDKENFPCLVFRDIPQAMNRIADSELLIVMLDYNTIVSSERKSVIDFFRQLSGQKIVMYNVPENANRRLAFYELGATRVYDASLGPEEIVLSLKWLLYQSDLVEEKPSGISRGTLETLSLAQLIQNIARENRSGVLRLITPGNSGKLYFYEGNIVTAQVGPFKNDQAVLHMLFWEHGRFSFKTIAQHQTSDEMMLSTAALYIRFRELEEEHRRRMQDLGDPGLVVRAQNVGDLRALSLNIEPAMIEYLRRPQSIRDLMENPVYPCFETSEILLRLLNNGFLLTSEPYVPESKNKFLEEPQEVAGTGLFDEKEIKRIRERLNLADEKRVKLAVLSANDQLRFEVIRSLAGGDQEVQRQNEMEAAPMKLSDDLNVLLLGVALNQMIMHKIESLFDEINGYIFVVDGDDPEQFEYNNYIITQLTSLFPAAAVVAVAGIKSKKEVEALRQKFQTAKSLPWVPYKPDDHNTARKIFLAMQYQQETAEPQEEGAQQE